jgi:UreD urease accessory protein
VNGPSDPGSRPGRRRGWTAELVFTRALGGRTVLRIARVRAPLAFTRPFAATDDAAVAEVWLQSTNGGLHAGDDVSVRIVVEEGATARVAPQAATVVCAAARGQGAHTFTELVVEEGGRLEWTPPPTVLLPGSQLDAATWVLAAPGAAAIAAEVYVQHVPSPAPIAASARLTAEMAAVVCGRTVAADRIAADGAWKIAAHGTIWSVVPEPNQPDAPNQPDGSDALVAELLRQGFAVGALPNRAGVGVRLAGAASAVHAAARQAVVAIRAAQPPTSRPATRPAIPPANRPAVPLAGLPTGLPSWTGAAPSPPSRRLRRDLVPRIRPQ